MKDYDINMQYHPRKADVLARALNWKATGALNHLFIQRHQLIKEMEELELKIVARDEGGFCATIIAELMTREEIKLK